MEMNGDEWLHTKPLPGSKICEKVTVTSLVNNAITLTKHVKIQKSFYKELQAIDDREQKGYYNMLYTV